MYSSRIHLYYVLLSMNVVFHGMMQQEWAVLGVMPPSFLAIKAGQTLQQLTSSSDAVSWTSVLVLAGLAVFSLMPVIFKQWLKKKFD